MSSSSSIVNESEELVDDGDEEEEDEEDEEEEEVIDDDILVEDVVDKAADRFLIGTGGGSKRRKPKPPSTSSTSSTKPVFFDECPEFKRPEPSETDMTLLQIARIPGYPHKTAAVAEIDSKVAEYWIIIWLMKTYMEAQGDKPPELDLSFEEDITGESGGKI